MATIHRILLAVIDNEEYPDDSVLHSITSSTDGVRVLEHETVTTPWSNDHFLNRDRLSLVDFERWFRRATGTAPTVQTVISLVRCVPDGTEDKKWIKDTILPLLFADSIPEALALIRDEDEPGKPRSFLMSLTHDLLDRCHQPSAGGF